MSHRGFEPRSSPVDEGALTPWTNETVNFIKKNYFIIKINYD